MRLQASARDRALGPRGPGLTDADMATLDGKLAAAASSADLAGIAAEAAEDAVAEVPALINRDRYPYSPIFNALLATQGNMREGFVFERLDLTYLEWACYTPLDISGIWWERHFHSHRLSPGNKGAPVRCFSTLAMLTASTAITRATPNITTKTLATAPVSVQTPANRTATTGSWQASGTITGVANVTYPNPQNAGATSTWEVDNTAGNQGRVYLETMNNASNGGIGKVLIRVKATGVEIASNLYCVPLVSGERRVHLDTSVQVTTSPNTLVPLTFDLPNAVCEIIWSESSINGASKRAYAVGPRTYPPIAYNAVGLHGLAEEKTLGTGVVGNLMAYPGSGGVMFYPNATQIDFSYIQNTTGGIVDFALFDSAGNPVSSLDHSSVDTYGSGTAKNAYVTVKSELPRGNYYLHWRIAATKNAAETARFAVYENGGAARDLTTSGIPGVDRFNILDCPQRPANGLDAGTHMLQGPANQEFALRVRKTTDPVGSQVFVSGLAHGHEDSPASVLYQIDGADRTADALDLPVGGMLAGKTGRINFTTQVKFGDDSPLGTLNYDMNYSRDGYLFGGLATYTVDHYRHDDYAVMLQAPSRIHPNGANAGGGCDLLMIEGDKAYRLNQHNNSAGQFSGIPNGMFMVNDDFALAGIWLNKPSIDLEHSNAKWGGSGGVGQWNSYASGLNKGYLRLFAGDPTTGVLVTAGEETTRKWVLYRSFIGPSMRLRVGL